MSVAYFWLSAGILGSNLRSRCGTGAPDLVLIVLQWVLLMIDVSLAFLTQILDRYLRLQLGLDHALVVLNSLVNADGSVPEKNQNKVVITLINLEYESNRQFYNASLALAQDTARLNPPVIFNLDIIISANFDDYTEALKLISLITAFFQENPGISRSQFPSMPTGLAMLKVEIESSSSHKTHNLWTALGAKYLPSVMYKVRQVRIQGNEIQALDPNISSSTAQARL